MINLFQLMERISKGNLKVTRQEALEIATLMNPKKGQVVEYYWKENKIWISIWNIELDIIDENNKK